MTPTEQHYVFPPSVPTALVVLLALVAVGAWIFVHRVRMSGRTGSALAFAGRIVIGFLAMLAAAQALQRGLVLATNWPIWLIALLGAAAVEIVLALYRLERRTVSRRAGLGLIVLRVAIVALVVAMLAQPVRTWTVDKTIQRFVAVLVDTSASMFVPDTQLAPAEKMQLAEALDVEGAARPFRLDAVAATLASLGQDVSAQGEGLAPFASADEETRKRQLSARREGLHTMLVEADRKAGEASKAVLAPLSADLKLDDRVKQGMDAAAKRIDGPVRELLREAVTLTTRENAANLAREQERLLRTLRDAAKELGESASAVAALSKGVDEAVYAALDPDRRAKVNAAAGRKRLALAHDVLLHKPVETDAAGKTTTGKSLLEELEARYGVRLYTFASKPEEQDLASLRKAYEASGGAAAEEAAELPPAQQQTDFTGVFEKVMAETAGVPLSGILLLSDGRHNAPLSVEPLVRQLGVRQVPVSSVVFGADKPPLDAGIISVEAPEVIATRDRMLVTTEVKLDGLAGQEVRVDLMDGDKPVDTQTVRVPTDAYRARVQLSDEPAAAGLHHYAVQVQKFDGEVLETNNAYPLAVSVSDDRTNLLLIDERPRWEFRYIKNLFASRDRTVRLQYVLLEPDRIEGVPPAPIVHASAGRPLDEVEANALPKDEAEWMKFDVILLGDVSPKTLTEEHQRILRKFVADRGGSLVVVSGPLFTPHAYPDTPLADLLPATFKASDGAVFTSPEKHFRIALTAEGRESVITRQKMNPEDNLEVWDSMPDIYWRHPDVRAKEGATVLAYALPPSPPAFIPLPGAAADDAATGDDVLKQRREFERDHALVIHHNVALGKVLFLSFDRTWRMRYLVGDTYHHRFWGQVLRWATASKLPAGTETVKLGTDRTRYPTGASINVRAKMATKDYTPIVSEDASVAIYAGDKIVLRKRLQFVENSAGLYEANLGDLPAGTYRAELDAPAARPTLNEQNAEGVQVEFSVDPSTPAEQAELAPDRGLLSRLANLTGGRVSDPAHAPSVLEGLGRATEIEVEPHEYEIWDSVPLLVLLVVLATGEWLLRKKVGLA